MKLYKLTDEDGYTRRGLQSETRWYEGASIEAKEKGNTLCTPQVIHAYTSPLLAVLLNPTHSNINEPLLWEAEGDVIAQDSTKVGVKRLTTLRQIELPHITIEQKIKIAIYCALKIETNSWFVEWAYAWLDNTDRTKKTAVYLARAAYAPLMTASRASVMAAVWMARALSEQDAMVKTVSEREAVAEVAMCVTRARLAEVNLHVIALKAMS